jgi:predicted site-specific integrase-resolvase
MENPAVINTSEACEILGGINRSTLKRWVDDGKVVALRKLPGETAGYLFDRAVIEAVAEQDKAATS